MHASLIASFSRRAAAAVLACAVLSPASASASPPASPAPTASPTPSPPPHRRVDAVPASRENLLGRIIVHASTREGYDVPVAELLRLGARTVADALRFVPGVFVEQSGTTGTLQTVALRGASAPQTLVLLDGRPVNEGDTGVTDFSSMPLAGVERISVIEGGLSTQYGSGAVGGVVQIVSRRPSSQEPSAYAQVGYQGDFEDGIGASFGSNLRGVRVDAFTRAARNVFDYPSFNGIAGGTRTNNDVRTSDIKLCVCYSIGPVNAALHLEDNTSDVGGPGSTEFGPAFVSKLARQQRDVNRGDLGLELNTSASATQLVLFADGRRVHFFDPTPPFSFDTFTQETARGYSLTEAFRLARVHTVRIGYEGRGDRALFAGTFNTPPHVVVASSSSDVYVSDTFDNVSQDLELVGGLRNDRTQGVPATTVPTFSVRKRVGGVDNTFMRASYARAFRAPNLDERFFPGFGNPQLQPEHATTFDAGVVTRAATLSGTASIFGSDTTNLIVNQAIDQIGDFLPFNVGRARVRGFSLQVSNGYGMRVGAQASYTGYPVARDLSTAPDINGVLTGGNRLLRRPTAMGSFEIWRKAGFESADRRSIGEDGLDLRFVGRRYGDEENKHLLPPYVSLGAHLSRNVGEHLTLTVRADNLTGQRVEEVYGYPVLGTTFSVRLTAH